MMGLPQMVAAKPPCRESALNCRLRISRMDGGAGSLRLPSAISGLISAVFNAKWLLDLHYRRSNGRMKPDVAIYLSSSTVVQCDGLRPIRGGSEVPTISSQRQRERPAG